MEKADIGSVEAVVDEFAQESLYIFDEALDGDGVDTLCMLVKAKLNLAHGNINEEDYDFKMLSIKEDIANLT